MSRSFPATSASVRKVRPTLLSADAIRVVEYLGTLADSQTGLVYTGEAVWQQPHPTVPQLASILTRTQLRVRHALQDLRALAYLSVDWGVDIERELGLPLPPGHHARQALWRVDRSKNPYAPRYHSPSLSVPRRLLHDGRHTLTSLKLALYLWDWWQTPSPERQDDVATGGAAPVAWQVLPNQRELAYALATDFLSISRAIALLEQWGYLTRQHRTYHTVATLYYTMQEVDIHAYEGLRGSRISRSLARRGARPRDFTRGVELDDVPPA